jgi:predicted PurR-regulated permease PerM
MTSGDLIRDRYADIGSVALALGLSLAQAFGVFLTVLVLTMYWLRGYDDIKDTLVSYFPKRYQLRAEDVWLRIETKLSRWFLGQMLISTAVGVAVWLTALALGLPFAGVLGILAALLEIIPLVGPILASVPAILFGLSESLEKGLIVVLAYVIIQQLESQVLSPILMGKAVHLHPIVIITSFLIGTILYGLIGGLLAVPTALLVSGAVDSFREDDMLVHNVAKSSQSNTKTA